MDERFDQLSADAEALMERYSVPGLTMGMMIDGVEHTATLGLASIETGQEVTSNTLFQIGSTAKTVAAIHQSVLTQTVRPRIQYYSDGRARIERLKDRTALIRMSRRQEACDFHVASVTNQSCPRHR